MRAGSLALVWLRKEKSNLLPGPAPRGLSLGLVCFAIGKPLPLMCSGRLPAARPNSLTWRNVGACVSPLRFRYSDNNGWSCGGSVSLSSLGMCDRKKGPQFSKVLPKPCLATGFAAGPSRRRREGLSIDLSGDVLAFKVPQNPPRVFYICFPHVGHQGLGQGSLYPMISHATLQPVHNRPEAACNSLDHTFS